MTWLTPYIEAWERQYGGTPVAGVLAGYLRPLEKLHGPEDVVARWKAYLAKADPLYASPSRFAQTYGSWKPKRELKKLADPLNEEG